MKYMILLAVFFVVAAWTFRENRNIGLDNKKILTPSIYKKGGCPTSFGDNYSGTGYYAYPEYNLNMAGVSPGLVMLSCDANDVPNRVTVYDRNHNTLVSTGWFGTASYSGPWGSSIAINGPLPANFTKGTDSIYYIKVETAPVPGGLSDAFFIQAVGCP